MARNEFVASPPDAEEAVALSVVVPLFEEEAIVPVLVGRLARVLDEMGVEAEVILVDDGSTDGTLGAIARAHAADRRFGGLALSRNFGHQLAITAGLAQSRGRAVVVMDGDLQDPPEAIPALWRKWREGYDVVYAIRARRPEGICKRLAYAAFYRILGRVVALAIPRDAGDFAILSRRVVDLLNAMPERRRFLRGLRAWVGFRQAGLPIARSARHAGRPKFTPAKLLDLALDGLIGFGEAPLRWAGGLGIAAVGLALAGLVAAAVGGFAGRPGPPGWAGVGLLVLFLGGTQLLSAAILGEYVSRIAQDVNGRPLYVVRRRIGLESVFPPKTRRSQRSRGRRLPEESLKTIPSD
jgi:polyisoprenyl-phosphate glycosyltransferase